MSLKKLINVVVFFALVLVVHAQAIVITDERGKIEVQVPKEWRYEKNILGIPHVFLTNESPRSTLSITITGIDGVKLPVDNLEKTQKEYQSGRKEWATSRNAQNLNFLPYSNMDNAEKVKIHQIGFEYDLGGKRYLEKTYYVECPKSLVNLKLLALKSSMKISDAELIVKSLLCDPKNVK